MKHKISLIIPLKDEENSVSALLDSVFNQSRRPNEIVITDAGSRDRTREIIKEYISRGEPIRLIEAEGAHPGKARNIAITASKFDIIAMTDGGIVLDKDWLKELEDTMESDPEVDVVYGNYTPRTDTFFKQCLSLAFVPPLKLIEGEKMRYFIASSILKKRIWQAVGGFPGFRAGEDRIFIEKVEKRRFKIRYNGRAVVQWDIPPNLKGTFGRFYNYSYHDLKAGRARDWHVPVLKMYIMALVFILLGIFVLPVFFLVLVMAYICRVIHKISANRDEPYFKFQYVPLYFVVTGFLIFFIDMAMFTGWVKYKCLK